MSKGNDKKAKGKKDNKPQAAASSYKLAQGKPAANQTPFMKKIGAK
jgi:hypothetical protein